MAPSMRPHPSVPFLVAFVQAILAAAQLTGELPGGLLVGKDLLLLLLLQHGVPELLSGVL